MMDRKHKGAQSELIAAAWLLSLGYEVFRNVSAHGLVDIVALKDGEVEYFDVKSEHPNCKPNPYTKADGVRLGLKHIIVSPTGICHILEAVERPIVHCVKCGEEFKPWRKRHQYCSPECRDAP